MTTEERYKAILRNHLPADAVDWVYNYLDRYKVHFHVARSRTSKLGDYRWPQPRHPFHEISVNGDLTKPLFLWVFLHEAAHLETHLSAPGASPHGHQWQESYRTLLMEHIAWFPVEVQPMIDQLVRRVPLQRRLVQQIERALRSDATHVDNGLVLDQLPAGSRFQLVSHPSKVFVSIERRRTRWLCRELSSGRQYTVSAMAAVVCADE